MFGKKEKTQNNEQVRKLLHDLRGKHHAAKLNAEAIALLAKKLKSDSGERIQKHAAFLARDLEELRQELEKLSTLVREK